MLCHSSSFAIKDNNGGINDKAADSMMLFYTQMYYPILHPRKRYYPNPHPRKIYFCVVIDGDGSKEEAVGSK